MVRDRTHRTALDELHRERDKRELVEKQIAYQQTLIQFLCARVNHLERNNVVLLKAVTKLDFDLPHMTAAPAPASFSAAGPSETVADMLKAVGGGSLFEDMGEEEARRQGIGWNADGTVKYDHKPADTEH